MNRIKEEFDARKDWLERLLAQKSDALLDSPPGHLRTSSCRGHETYYHQKEDGTPPHYLRRSEQQLIAALCEKDYNNQIIKAAKKELKAVSSYLSAAPETMPEEVWASLPVARQKYVAPLSESDDAFLMHWKKETFSRKENYSSEKIYQAESGDIVRSKSEVLIANLLFRKGIPFRYEATLQLHGFGTVHPDFTLLHIKQRKEVYLEHFGMMDDIQYSRKALNKINAYIRNGYFPGDQFLFSFESKEIPFDESVLAMQLDNLF